MLKRNKNPRLINTYSGLSKLYASEDKAKLKKYQEFAKETHLYDPQFFLGTVKGRKVNFFTAMFGNKKGKIIIDIKRLMNCTEALIYSLHLVQYQVYNAKDIQTGERLTQTTMCLTPDFDLVYEFIDDYLIKWINHDYLDGNKKVFDMIESGEYKNECQRINSEAVKAVPLIWCKGHECKDLFTKLGFGHKGYIYGEMKPYKKAALTKNDKAIMMVFMKRGKEDLEKFTKEVEEKGLSTAFKEWYKGKKFIDSNIAFIMINSKIGLRSKAFKRFAAKIDGANFDRVVAEYAKDKRSNNSGTKGAGTRSTVTV